MRSSAATRPRTQHRRAWTALVVTALLALVAVGRARLGATSRRQADTHLTTAEPTGAGRQGDPGGTERSTGAAAAAGPPAAPNAVPVADLAAPAIEPATAPQGASAPTVAAQHSNGASSGGLRIESVLVGPTYERFTCPKPITRFSLRAHQTVNVCLQVEHRPQPDHVTLVWERNGAFYGKTPLELPGTHTNVRTRAHMKIGQSRLGSWSVRVVTDRNVTLAQVSFDVEP
jgi:hypothetical protein